MILKTKIMETIIETISLLFILLFVYAAVTKLLVYEQFRVQIGQSPIISLFADWIAWSVPAVEILIALLLVFSTTRFLALYASLGLMVIFTAYIFMILYFSDTIPCSCGGVLELNWTEHLIFNIVTVLLGLTGIVLSHVQSARNKKYTKNSNKKFIAQ